jgi:hypothetical protein
MPVNVWLEHGEPVWCNSDKVWEINIRAFLGRDDDKETAAKALFYCLETNESKEGEVDQGRAITAFTFDTPRNWSFGADVFDAKGKRLCVAEKIVVKIPAPPVLPEVHELFARQIRVGGKLRLRIFANSKDKKAVVGQTGLIQFVDSKGTAKAFVIGENGYAEVTPPMFKDQLGFEITAGAGKFNSILFA